MFGCYIVPHRRSSPVDNLLYFLLKYQPISNVKVKLRMFHMRETGGKYLVVAGRLCARNAIVSFLHQISL